MPAALVLALAAVLAPVGPATAAPADDIHALLNQARWSNGQAGLIRNAAMDQVAADWAAQLAASGTLSHNPDFASQIPGGLTGAAENVAQGHPTAAAMHDGWMNSSGHRANILGDYTDVGIAFLSSGGTTWGVEVFARYPGHVGPAAPAAAPAPAPEPAAEAAPPTTPPVTPSPSPTPSASAAPTPEVTTSSDDSGTAEIVTLTREDGPPIAAGWWIGLVAGVAAVAAATLGVIRRRRYFVER